MGLDSFISLFLFDFFKWWYIQIDRYFSKCRDHKAIGNKPMTVTL